MEGRCRAGCWVGLSFVAPRLCGRTEASCGRAGPWRMARHSRLAGRPNTAALRLCGSKAHPAAGCMHGTYILGHLRSGFVQLSKSHLTESPRHLGGSCCLLRHPGRIGRQTTRVGLPCDCWFERRIAVGFLGCGYAVSGESIAAELRVLR